MAPTYWGHFLFSVIPIESPGWIAILCILRESLHYGYMVSVPVKAFGSSVAK